MLYSYIKYKKLEEEIKCKVFTLFYEDVIVTKEKFDLILEDNELKRKNFENMQYNSHTSSLDEEWYEEDNYEEVEEQEFYTDIKEVYIPITTNTEDIYTVVKNELISYGHEIARENNTFIEKVDIMLA